MIKTLFYISTLLVTCMAHGQDMLIEQIAGKEITRSAYNKEKELISRQVFKVGPMQDNDNRLRVELQMNLYDGDGNLSKSYTTLYVCEPGKSDVLLSVFPFARKADAEYVIDASSPGFKRLYDFEPDDKILEDLSLEMSIESGLLGFFGSKNIMSITERKLSQNKNGFTLKSNITIKAYLWGVKVKTIRYKVTEKLDPNKQLLNQMFMAEDGSYFLMNY